MSTGTKGDHLAVYCFIISVAIIFGGAMTVVILIDSSQPDELKFAVSNAILTRFEFSASDLNSTLSYSLALNLTVTNPNNKGGVYFEWFQVIAEYRDTTVGVATLAATPFRLRPHNTTALKAVLEGNQAMNFEKEKDIETYQLEKESRVFSVDVKIALRLRNVTFKKTKKYLEPSKIDCKLKIPLSSGNSIIDSSSRTMVFKATSCRNVYIFTSPPIPRGSGLYGR